MENCIFCMIGRGEMEAKTVYEDEYVVAFDDIAPQAPIHTLIIPREHYSNLGDDLSEEVMLAIMRAIPKVASIKGADSGGYRVIVNNGKDANQTVGHLHVHIMGGRPMSHGMVNFATD